VPAYVVFSDATLQAIADARPGSRAELAGITGVGAVKLDRYGAAVLELCAGSAMPAAPGNTRPGGPDDRAGRTADQPGNDPAA
jgi:DNA helicase-2/ATP-dependent DNA helicase PcrA